MMDQHCKTCVCHIPPTTVSPCPRETAHGGHVHTMRVGPGDETYVWCDGVKAHRFTQIGGNERDFVAGGVRFDQCDSPMPHEQHKRQDIPGNTWCKGVPV